VVGGVRVPVGSQTCAAGCSSTVFYYLPPGATYQAEVAPASLLSLLDAAWSNPVTLQDTCLVGACVTVDTASPLGPADHAAQGFLHSVDPGGDEAAYFAALNPTMWRSWIDIVGSPRRLDWSDWAVAAATATPTTLVVSDEWRMWTGGKVTPWDNWSYYRSWVTWLTEQVLAGPDKVTYFDVYNEPDILEDYYTPLAYLTVTPSLLLEQFLVTYQAIKAVDPAAQIIGPSLGWYHDDGGLHYFGMTQFLDYAAANHLRLAAVSWHFLSGLPWEVTQEVADARQQISALPALGDPQIFINEYGIDDLYRIPGWDVAYLDALTDAQVTSAVRTCYTDECSAPALDGLLGLGGSTTLPDYWVRLAYGDMTGDMVATSSSDDFVTSVASYNAASGSVSMLLGRGETCVQNLLAPATLCTDPSPPEPVTVQVVVPWKGVTALVTGTDIPGQAIKAMAQPTPAWSTTLAVRHDTQGQGVVTFHIPALADGDAWAITLTRVG
jgi:hypothetical protein